MVFGSGITDSRYANESVFGRIFGLLILVAIPIAAFICAGRVNTFELRRKGGFARLIIPVGLLAVVWGITSFAPLRREVLTVTGATFASTKTGTVTRTCCIIFNSDQTIQQSLYRFTGAVLVIVVILLIGFRRSGKLRLIGWLATGLVALGFTIFVGDQFGSSAPPFDSSWWGWAYNPSYKQSPSGWFFLDLTLVSAMTLLMLFVCVRQFAISDNDLAISSTATSVEMSGSAPDRMAQWESLESPDECES